ncbi:MAG: P-loop NTPase [SAR324 cluster bacterium]|nr:P-loop NTPase [SAR324 cluster bacterium]
MDLQQQFEAVFAGIPYGNSGDNLLEANVIHGCVVNHDFAKVSIILEEDSALRHSLPSQIEEALKGISEINRVAVEIFAEAPPDEEEKPNSEPQRPAQQPQRSAYLQNYENVIAVASGKGGVGKSTVAVNLALALAKKGYKVSLFDADIYGPSLPIMMGLRNAKPEIVGNKLIPISKHGIDMLSIGNLVDEASAMIWRGPMVNQALEQMLRDTRWPGGDFMILDLPPGTGDAQLTLSQTVEIAGAVIVSTPQDVALLDAAKAVAMFEKVDIDIVGIVENMSSFVCPHCQKETPIFSSNGAQKESEKLDVPFLGSIPIELAVRQGGDEGKPLMTEKGDSAAGKAFSAIAENIIKSLETL